EQLRAKAKASRFVAQEALGEIVSILRQEKAAKSSPVSETSPLFLAVAAAAEHMGVEVRAPARSGDLERLKNQAESITRASQIRPREVILRAGWWSGDSGALVGSIAVEEGEARPVALLPESPGRYVIFDPADGSRRRVTAQVATTISPKALALYRP